MPQDPLADKLREALHPVSGKTVVIKKSKKDGTPDRRVLNGGKGGIGRKTHIETLEKRGIATILDGHFNEEIDVPVRDRKTGQTVIVKKPRILGIMEKLYQIAMNGEGSHEAASKWLDRAIGKPIQVVAGDSDKPIVLRIDF